MNLFVFGTLLIDDVVIGLLNTVPDRCEATLQDYRRGNIEVPGRVGKGPAIIASHGDHVKGGVLKDLTEQQIKVLDLFESVSPGYLRTSGSVETKSGGQCPASFYASTAEISEFISLKDWSIEAFTRDYLDEYITQRIPKLVAGWRSQGLIG